MRLDIFLLVSYNIVYTKANNYETPNREDDKMQMTLVKYRTNTATELSVANNWWTEYAIVPTIWLSDLFEWLLDISAVVVETTDNFDHEPRLPINWPSYETCRYGIAVSDAIHCVL